MSPPPATSKCPPVKKINRIISTFREKGWTVKILTSRGVDMKDITGKHLEQSGVDLTLDDVIFKEFHTDGSGKLLRKNESLIEWMKGQSLWNKRKTIRVLFLDDYEKYCIEVARVADDVERASVTCFHYTGSLPNPELSQVQMERLVVQLHAYREGRQIPYANEQSQLQEAMDGLTRKPIMTKNAQTGAYFLSRPWGPLQFHSNYVDE